MSFIVYDHEGVCLSIYPSFCLTDIYWMLDLLLLEIWRINILKTPTSIVLTIARWITTACFKWIAELTKNNGNLRGQKWLGSRDLTIQDFVSQRKDFRFYSGWDEKPLEGFEQGSEVVWLVFFRACYLLPLSNCHLASIPCSVPPGGWPLQIASPSHWWAGFQLV